MTAHNKFLAVAALVIAIAIAGKVARDVAVLMAVGLLIVLYVAWTEIDRQ